MSACNSSRNDITPDPVDSASAFSTRLSASATHPAEEEIPARSPLKGVQQMLGINKPAPAAPLEQAEPFPDRPSAVEQVQQLLGIETERERVAREAETFYLDPGDVRQQAGIARGEEMVKSLQRDLLEQRNLADAAGRPSVLQNEIAQAQQIVEAYREQTGRDPAPILTQEQRDYLHENSGLIHDRGEREKLLEGLDRAVISGESGREATLDYDLTCAPAQVQELEQVRDLSWVIEL